MFEYRIQLKDAITGATIQSTGGVCYVAEAGGAAKVTLYDKTGASASNPSSLTRGFINFFTAETVTSVDLYILAPGGQFVVATGIVASGPNEILVDTGNRMQCMKIPFSADDFTAASENLTGFTEPTNALMLPDPAVLVTTLDATETIDLGTLSTDSGDADGFIAAASVAAAALVPAVIGFDVGTNNTVVDITGGDVEWTLGALFHPAGTKVAKSEGGDAAATDGNGFAYKQAHVSGGKAITYTPTAGSDTAEGFFLLPYLLAA